MKLKKIIIIFEIFVVLILFTGCKNDSENLENQKNLCQVQFLENQCISIFNKYIFDDYIREDKTFNWDYLYSDYIVLNNSIDAILIDFASAQIPRKTIVELESNINELSDYIESKDEIGFMLKICDCYNLVSNDVLNNISEIEINKMKQKAKSNLLYVGYYIYTSDRQNCLIWLENFQKNNDVLNSTKEYLDNNSYKINRIFILYQKLKSSIEIDEFERGKKNLQELLEYF